LALDYAREAASPELEARALSGLGDAYYLRGRMITAHDRFQRCLELCGAHGFGRIEVANLYMRGTTNLYQNNLDAALADCNASAEAAVRIGHLRAEMVARGGVLVYVLMEMDQIAEAEKQAVRALAIARQLGAGRFEPFSLLNLSKIMILEDRRAEAVKNLEEAARVSRETGITFLGAWVQGVLALAATDPAVRAEALGEGEEILRQDCVGHNYFWFYRDAMEASLEDADWDGVRRYAAALETYTKPEPLPWCDFFIARGRVLAAFGDGESNGAGGEATVAELRRLRDEAVRVGLKSAMTALDAALGAAPDTE
jgi:tetratricopeptide (TPR) repeat protein